MCLMCCFLSQGSLAVLALHLARQIHFHAPLIAGPQPAERCSWHSPLYCFLSSSWWHPHFCEFSILRGQLGQVGSFSGPGSISGHTSGKEPSAAPCLFYLEPEGEECGEVRATLGVGHACPWCSSVSFYHLPERKPPHLGSFRPWVWLPAQSSTSSVQCSPAVTINN